MNKKVQSLLWKVFGTMTNIAFPAAYVGIRWGFITESAASTQVSVYVLIAAIAALPAVSKQIPKIKVNYIGVIIAALGAMGYFIGAIMLQIGACVIAGNVSCNICFWQADKLREEYDENKLADNIAARMSANKE